LEYVRIEGGEEADGGRGALKRVLMTMSMAMTATDMISIFRPFLFVVNCFYESSAADSFVSGMVG